VLDRSLLVREPEPPSTVSWPGYETEPEHGENDPDEPAYHSAAAGQPDLGHHDQQTQQLLQAAACGQLPIGLAVTEENYMWVMNAMMHLELPDWAAPYADNHVFTYRIPSRYYPQHIVWNRMHSDDLGGIHSGCSCIFKSFGVQPGKSLAVTAPKFKHSWVRIMFQGAPCAWAPWESLCLSETAL
jgi:hypothetical protein